MARYLCFYSNLNSIRFVYTILKISDTFLTIHDSILSKSKKTVQIFDYTTFFDFFCMVFLALDITILLIFSFETSVMK